MKIQLLPGEEGAAITDRARRFQSSILGTKAASTPVYETLSDETLLEAAGEEPTAEEKVTDVPFAAEEKPVPSAAEHAPVGPVKVQTVQELLSHALRQAPVSALELELDLGASTLKLRWKGVDLQVNKDELTLSFCMNSEQMELTLSTGSLLRIKVENRVFNCSYLLSFSLIKNMPWKRLVFTFEQPQSGHPEG